MGKAFLFILLCIVACSCVKDPDNGSASQPGIKVRLITSGYSDISTKVPYDDSAIINVWVLQYINGTLVGKTFFPESTSWLSGFNLLAYPMSVGPGNVVYFFANTTVNGTDPLLDDTVFAVGTSTLSDLNAYHFPISEASFDNYIPMRGEYTSAIGSALNITVPMTRMAAKISFSFDATSLNQFIASSIQLCQVPAVTVLPPNANQPPLPIAGETAADPIGFTPYPVGNVFADYAEQPVGINLTGQGSFIWYMAENVRGSFPNVTSNLDKYPTSPPIGDNGNQTRYSYILLKGSCIDSSGNLLDVSYRIYLGGNSTGDMNIIANTDYEIITTITGTDSADTRITAAGTIITDTPPLSNCYILNATGEGQVIFIPVLQAVNGIARVRESNTSIPVFDPVIANWSAEILWQTWQATSQSDQLVVSRVRGADGQQYIRVVLPPDVQNGNNALIAIRDEIGILWSWHLWITDYNPYPDNGLPVNGQLHTYAGGAFQPGGWANTKKIMDRNLGAMWTGGTPQPQDVIDDPAKADRAYGLLYQWGRKDPFPGANGLSITEAIPIYGGDTNSPELNEGTGLGTGINRVLAPTGNNLVNAVRNPKTFYYSTTGDWYTSTNIHNDDLWARPNISTPKSVFDPCPVGYRVPESGNTAIVNPWVSFGDGVNATNFNAPSTNFVWYANGINQGAGAEGNTITPTAGRLYIINEVNAWYPATGYRAAKNGQFMNNTTNAPIVGSFASSWSASGNGITSVLASYMAFDNVNVRPNGNSNRSFGFGVRCVQE